MSEPQTHEKDICANPECLHPRSDHVKRPCRHEMVRRPLSGGAAYGSDKDLCQCAAFVE
jgi:hypothetical protein